jgi:hypothetical protein
MRSFITYNVQVKGDEMGMACSTWERRGMYVRIWLDRQKERYHLESQDVGGWIFEG